MMSGITTMNSNLDNDDDHEEIVDDDPVFYTVQKKKKKKKATERRGVYQKYGQLSPEDLETLKATERDLKFRIVKQKKRPSRAELFRRKVDNLMNNPGSSPWAMMITIFIMIVIMLSTIAFIVESWPTFQHGRSNSTAWFLTETTFITIFTIEYIIRLLSAKNYIQFIISPLNVIDLVAIIPYFIDLILRMTNTRVDAINGLLVLRVVRIARVFRVFKLGRYSEVFQVVILAMIHSIDAMVLLVFFLLMGLILFSSLVYYAEQTQAAFDESLGCWVYTDASEDPGKISPYQSIPHTIWWCIVTMTTVGYGDTFPITPLGKAVAGVTMLCGLLLLAFPVGVLGAKFTDQYEAERKELAKNRMRKAMSDNIALDRLNTLELTLHKMELYMSRLKPKVEQLNDRYSEAKNLARQLQQDFPNRQQYLRRGTETEMDALANMDL